MYYIEYDAIASAPAGSPLHGQAPIQDPRDSIIEVHLAALKWNILQRLFGLVEKGVAADAGWWKGHLWLWEALMQLR